MKCIQHFVIEALFNDIIPLPDSPYPQETGIIRAMETGNTSPSLSSSPSFLCPLFFLSLSPLRCAFICTNYQVQTCRVRPIMSPVMAISVSYIFGFTGNEGKACACFFVFLQKAINEL